MFFFPSFTMVTFEISVRMVVIFCVSEKMRGGYFF